MNLPMSVRDASTFRTPGAIKPPLAAVWRACRLLSAPAAAVALAAALALAPAGCEVNSSAHGIEIAPGSAALSPGQAQTFTASGGYGYEWALDPENPALVLGPRHGDTVVVTFVSNAAIDPGRWESVALVCTSTMRGVSDAGGATNGVSGILVEDDRAIIHLRPPK
jgi:hypothetical protein